LSVEGKRGTKQGKIPNWEVELWSYICNGDGIVCPIYFHCQKRLSGDWCPSDNIDCIARLVDESRFDAGKYDFVGKGGKCGRIFQLVERLAHKYLKIAGIYGPPVPAEIVSLADEWRSIEVRLVPLKIHHGAIWCLNECWIIQLNENDIHNRRRFALFHEGFHILAHCRGNPIFKKSQYAVGSFNELLADYFAGAILMPREWVKEKWAEINDLGRMAKIFDVPKALMWVRLREIGLI
jgi:hypothetical protein